MDRELSVGVMALPLKVIIKREKNMVLADLLMSLKSTIKEALQMASRRAKVYYMMLKEKSCKKEDGILENSSRKSR